MKIQEKVHPAPFFGREEKPLPSQQPTNSRNDLRKLTARKSKVFEVEDWHVEIIFRVFVSLGGETSKTFYFHPDPRKNDPIWLVCISNALKTPTIVIVIVAKKKPKQLHLNAKKRQHRKNRKQQDYKYQNANRIFWQQTSSRPLDFQKAAEGCYLRRYRIAVTGAVRPVFGPSSWPNGVGFRMFFFFQKISIWHVEGGHLSVIE